MVVTEGVMIWLSSWLYNGVVRQVLLQWSYAVMIAEKWGDELVLGWNSGWLS